MWVRKDSLGDSGSASGVVLLLDADPGLSERLLGRAEHPTCEAQPCTAVIQQVSFLLEASVSPFVKGWEVLVVCTPSLPISPPTSTLCDNNSLWSQWALDTLGLWFMGKMPTGFRGRPGHNVHVLLFFIKRRPYNQKALISVLNWWVHVTFTTVLLVLLPSPTRLRLHVCNAFSSQMYLLSNISLHFYLLKAHRTANQGLLALGNNATTLNGSNSIYFL